MGSKGLRTPDLEFRIILVRINEVLLYIILYVKINTNNSFDISSSGIPIYACRICGKHFARKLSVRGHMKSHSKLFEHKHKHKQVKVMKIV